MIPVFELVQKVLSMTFGLCWKYFQCFCWWIFLLCLTLKAEGCWGYLGKKNGKLSFIISMLSIFLKHRYHSSKRNSFLMQITFLVRNLARHFICCSSTMIFVPLYPWYMHEVMPYAFVNFEYCIRPSFIYHSGVLLSFSIVSCLGT